MAVIAFLFHLLVLQSVLFCLPSTSTALIKHHNETDQSALLSLKSHMDDPSKVMRNGWNVTIPVCKWIGVTCSSRHQRVVLLNLSYIGLQGRIAPEVGNLSFLKSIDLTGNSFQGSLPPEIKNLRRLRYINLRYNKFSGEVPSWLSYLPNLIAIDFSNNSFTGALPLSLFNASKLEQLFIPFNGLEGNIPQEIGTNVNLKYLNMNGNQLSGSIPQSFLNLTSLENFHFTANSLSGDLPLNVCSKLPKLQGIFLSANKLSGQLGSWFSNCSQLQMVSMAANNFSGPIPRGLGNLTRLRGVWLLRNFFTGEVPLEIGNLLNLEFLVVGENALTGEVPKEIGNLQKLVVLCLGPNSLSGPIPSSIFNMSSIKQIVLTLNKISGSLPSDIGHQLPNLQILYLPANRLSGVIPDSISNLTTLVSLDLGSNQLTGSIPKSLGSLTNLKILRVEDNHLTSSFAPELSFLTSLTNCRNLSILYIAANPLKGILPRTIANFSNNLEDFDARFCEIEGNIPHEIGNLSGLSMLDLGGNLHLNGPLPMEFQGLGNLQSLDLHGNQISGSVPSYFCGFRKLFFLNLGENQWTGQVPESLGNITSLRHLLLHSNRLNSSMPASLGRLKDLLSLDLHSNSLSNSIPQEIGNMKAAFFIDLSENEFSGNIPISMGGLENVVNLSLANNQLRGLIPEKLSNMLSLESFDLSGNHLAGEIPSSLGLLKQLKYFNVSFNNLRGRIPADGPFMKFPIESFMSNEALCGGPPHLLLPPCPSNSPHGSRTKRLRIVAYILIPIALTVSIIVCVLWVFLKVKRRKNALSGQIDLLPIILSGRVSYNELQHATNDFSESNLLARGSYGSVYNGVLRNGKMIAIKVFDLHLEGSFKSFGRECEVLRNIRHRNLVKVISSCSNLDFKALILEYMPNGSLEKWLHSDNYFLNLLQRLDIMIDVACALEYLHYGYSSTTVHCDLKPSNVLLDEQMTGCVCDFGIAKLFTAGESMAQTKTLATIGYIAPEYGSEGIVSPSCDVYSFGILLMETFSRKNPTHEMFTEDWGLKEWIAGLLQNSSLNFIDPKLITSQDQSSNAMVQCISSIMELALTCTVESLKERIDIKCALTKLKKIRVHFTQSEPVQRTARWTTRE